MKDAITLRNATEADWGEFDRLEQIVWQREQVSTLPQSVFTQWVHTHPQGFFLAHDGERLVGNAYCEIVDFDPDRLDSPSWQRTIHAELGGTHNPYGNSWYGISIGVIRPGVGKLLLDEIVRTARAQGKMYFVSVCRLSGLRMFLEESELALKRDQVALYYAIQCTRKFGGPLSPRLEHVEIPRDFPEIQRKDPVLCRFSRMGKVLHDVIPVQSFTDEKSCGFGAVVALKL